MKFKKFVRKLTLSLAVGLVAGFAFHCFAAETLDADHPRIKAAIAVQEQVTPDWMARADVLGTAVGFDDALGVDLIVYVDRDGPNVAGTVRSLPPRVRGFAVKVHPTDKFLAFRRSSSTSNTAKQTPPIKLGTSGGWIKDLANGYCCGGTLGSLIQVNGVQYILSNYHVFESDINPGGNGIIAQTGDPIIQPGLIDVSCNASRAQTVATLVKLGSLPNSNVDCSVAQVVGGMVDANGAILGIGTISQNIVAPALRQGVKKSGRTTGLTTSSISGLNATISVQYENECAGGVAFTKTFTGQIVIANKGSRFLNSGDSGSLMVENVSTNPRAVGLLYAGSSTSAIANPIDQVLAFIGSKLNGTATMVGNQGPVLIQSSF